MLSVCNKLFVAVPPQSTSDLTIFGMNSVRPTDEVQEVVYFPANDYAAQSVLKCTYTEVEQVVHVNAVVLSKPACCWGAEMGANEHGVCIGSTQFGSCVTESGLTGQDLVRLGLERTASAESAVDVLSELISLHGLIGTLDDTFPSVSVSFLICDRSEAWNLEAAGKHMVAVRVKSGVKCIDGELTIRTEFDKSSTGLREFASQHQRWSEGDGEFDFAKVFSNQPITSKSSASFQEIVGKGKFTLQTMLEVLRHPDYSSSVEGFSVAGSQLSLLPRPVANTGSTMCIHCFTATSLPDLSFFKPFVFGGDQASICDKTTCLAAGSEHALWAAHRRFTRRLDAGDKKSSVILANIRELEQKCFEDVDELVAGEPTQQDCCGKGEHVLSLFQHMVNLEINFYN